MDRQIKIGDLPPVFYANGVGRETGRCWKKKTTYRTETWTSLV